MRLIRLMGGVFILLTFCPLTVHAQPHDEASRLLHEAILVETVQGDLEQAITLYDEVVRRFPDRRALASEALFRTARCRELRGDPLAEVYYRRLVTEFPDAAALVSIAQSRLEVLNSLQGRSSQAPSRSVASPALEKVASLPWWMLVTDIAPDGTWLLFVDARSGDLNLWEPDTGHRIPLTRKGGLLPSGSGAHAIGAVFDPDGERVAYNWHDGSGSVSLRLVHAGRTDQEPSVWHPPYTYTHPLDFGPDDTVLVSVSRQGDAEYELHRVRVGSWEDELVHHLRAGPPLAGILRTDSDQVLFDSPVEPREYYGDVYASADDPATYRLLWGSPPHETLLGWSESLNGLFVQSYQGPVPSIFFARTPLDRPRWNFDLDLLRVRERLIPLGFTADRSLHVLTFHGVAYIWLLEEFWGLPAVAVARWGEYRAPQEFGQRMPFRRPVPILAHSREGTLLWAQRSRSHVLEIVDLHERAGEPRTVQYLSGPDVQTLWSPEGRYLAYLDPEEPYGWQGSGPRLFLYDVLREDREQWRFPSGSRIRLLAWSEDGRRILVQESSALSHRLAEVELGRSTPVYLSDGREGPLLEAAYGSGGDLVGMDRVSPAGPTRVVTLSRDGSSEQAGYETGDRACLLRTSAVWNAAAWVEYIHPAPDDRPSWKLMALRFGETSPRILAEGRGRRPLDVIWSDQEPRVGFVTGPDEIGAPGGAGEGPHPRAALTWVGLTADGTYTQSLPFGTVTSLRIEGFDHAAVIRPRNGHGTDWLRIRDLEASVQALIDEESSGGGGR